MSYSQVERQLKEWLNRRKVNKSVGRIPQLEEEQAELARSTGELSQLNDQLNQLEGERAQARPGSMPSAPGSWPYIRPLPSGNWIFNIPRPATTRLRHRHSWTRCSLSRPGLVPSPPGMP